MCLHLHLSGRLYYHIWRPALHRRIDWLSLSAAACAVDDGSLEGGAVAHGPRGPARKDARDRADTIHQDGTWALKQDQERGATQLRQEISDLAAQVQMLVGMLLDARSREADLEQAQRECIAEVTAVKESIRVESESCSKAVEQVLLSNIHQHSVCIPPVVQ